MKTFKVTEFKAKCLALLRDAQETGEPITITLHGKNLAIVKPARFLAESVASTLTRLRPLLKVEEEEFENAPRTSRPLTSFAD
jgi:prevent-host-death family protein